MFKENYRKIEISLQKLSDLDVDPQSQSHPEYIRIPAIN